jgi:hypothetical protein
VTLPPTLFTVQHQNLIYSNSPLPLADVKELADLKDLTDVEDLADVEELADIKELSEQLKKGRYRGVSGGPGGCHRGIVNKK